MCSAIGLRTRAYRKLAAIRSRYLVFVRVVFPVLGLTTCSGRCHDTGTRLEISGRKPRNETTVYYNAGSKLSTNYRIKIGILTASPLQFVCLKAAGPCRYIVPKNSACLGLFAQDFIIPSWSGSCPDGAD